MNKKTKKWALEIFPDLVFQQNRYSHLCYVYLNGYLWIRKFSSLWRSTEQPAIATVFKWAFGEKSQIGPLWLLIHFHINVKFWLLSFEFNINSCTEILSQTFFFVSCYLFLEKIWIIFALQVRGTRLLATIHSLWMMHTCLLSSDFGWDQILDEMQFGRLRESLMALNVILCTFLLQFLLSSF